MTFVLTPIDALPDCPDIDDAVMQGSRAAAVAMSEAAEAMHRNAAPPAWEGDEATLANHLMTATAKELDGSVAALQVGIAALDRFSDLVGGSLKQRHGDLAGTRKSLVGDAGDLAPRLGQADDPTIEADVTRHNSAVAAYNGNVVTWTKDLTDAEDTLIASLKRADTVDEGADLVSEVPNVPALVNEANALAKDPSKVFAWWNSLSRAQREALKAMRPEIIGNLDGIPLTDRDEANRANMTALRESIAEREGTDDMTERDKDDLDKLKGVEKGLGKSAGKSIPTFLMVFDPRAAHGDGHAAIAFGNPETADHVTVNVPGLTSEMKNFDGVAGDALTVQQATELQLKGTVASIAWLGYDAPSGGKLDALDFVGVAGEGKAADGAKNLSTFVDGLHATREVPKDVHLTVIGHSYGSTTVAKAAGDGMDADDIVLVGSPGAGDGNMHASDLTGNVYVGAADEDPVSRLGNPTPAGLGVDPATSDFGANRFAVDDGDRFAWTLLGLKNGLDNHTGYFNENSDSLADISKVAAGVPGEIHEVGGRGDFNDPGWWARRNAGAPIDIMLQPVTAAQQLTEPYVDSAVEHGRKAVDHAYDATRDAAASAQQKAQELAEQYAEHQRRMIDDATRRVRDIAGAVEGTAGDIKEGLEDAGRLVTGINPLRTLPGLFR